MKTYASIGKQYICSQCGKKFFVGSWQNWMYRKGKLIKGKYYKNPSGALLCSWTCMCAHQREVEKGARK